MGLSSWKQKQFSQKSLINRKKHPHALPQNVLVQQISIVLCCYYKRPRSRSHEVRNYRERAVPEKETKILKERVRGGAVPGVDLTEMKAQY